MYVCSSCKLIKAFIWFFPVGIKLYFYKAADQRNFPGKYNMSTLYFSTCRDVTELVKPICVCVCVSFVMHQREFCACAESVSTDKLFLRMLKAHIGDKWSIRSIARELGVMHEPHCAYRHRIHCRFNGVFHVGGPNLDLPSNSLSWRRMPRRF